MNIYPFYCKIREKEKKDSTVADKLQFVASEVESGIRFMNIECWLQRSRKGIYII